MVFQSLPRFSGILKYKKRLPRIIWIFNRFQVIRRYRYFTPLTAETISEAMQTDHLEIQIRFNRNSFIQGIFLIL